MPVVRSYFCWVIKFKKVYQNKISKEKSWQENCDFFVNNCQVTVDFSGVIKIGIVFLLFLFSQNILAQTDSFSWAKDTSVLAKDTLQKDSFKVKKKYVIQFEKNEIVFPENLKSFFVKLNAVHQKKEQKVSILHIGDSHIQGDDFSGTVRSEFQKTFGNAGRGLVFPYHQTRTYSPKDLVSTSNNYWQVCKNIIAEDTVPIGICGYTLATKNPGFNLNLYTKNRYGINYDYNRVHIFHGIGPHYGSFDAGSGENDYTRIHCKDTESQQTWKVSTVSLNQNSTDLWIYGIDDTVTKTYYARFFGFVFENTKNNGILYNTAGVSSAQLHHFMQSSLFFPQVAALKPDLVIVSLGTNESVNYNLNIWEYRTRIATLIQQLKNENPSVCILFTTPPDIVSRGVSPYKLPEICNAIFDVAEQNNCSVWDLNSIMGGKHSIYTWFASGMCSYDKIHFTQGGYKYQGMLLSQAIFSAYNAVATNKIDTSYYGQFARENQPVYISKPTPPPSIRPRIVPPNRNQGRTMPVVRPKPKVVYHTIRKGDNLSAIARRYGTNVNQLCRLNRIKTTTVLRPGMIIRVR